MAAADSPPTDTVVEKYNKSIEELKTFITSLSADAHASIQPLITGSINIDDNVKLNTFSQDIIDALTKLQSEKFEGSEALKYPYARNAIEEIKKIQAAADPKLTAVEISPESKAAGVKGRVELDWFRYYDAAGRHDPFKEADADDNDILSALRAGNVKSKNDIDISYKETSKPDGSKIRYAEYQGKSSSASTYPPPPVTCIFTSQYAFENDRKIVEGASKSGGKKSRQSRSRNRNRNRNRNRSNSAHGSKRR